MIYHYKLILQYKGNRFLGWQVQPDEAGLTVQGELNRALRVISNSTDIRSLGAGRTDSGVHALGQVAKISMPLNIPVEKLIKALNSNLPEDIRILSAEISDENFFPTVHAKSKEYHYRFTTGRSVSAFQNDLIASHPFELDIKLMKEACQVLIGKHDFSNFYCEGTDVSSNIRTIFRAEIHEVTQGEWQMLPAHFVFIVEGDGFLKQMVRLLMGALWNVGRGKISSQDLQAALSPVKIPRLGPVAPPEGLYMVRVNY